MVEHIIEDGGRELRLSAIPEIERSVWTHHLLGRLQHELFLCIWGSHPEDPSLVISWEFIAFVVYLLQPRIVFFRFYLWIVFTVSFFFIVGLLSVFCMISFLCWSIFCIILTPLPMCLPLGFFLKNLLRSYCRQVGVHCMGVCCFN